jgi:uncharacterized protein (TIGR00299 family) protein
MSSPSSPDRAEPPNPATLAIHLDLVGGIAGDMFVAAIADALPGLQRKILDALAAVRPEGAPMPEFAATMQAGLRASHFGVPATTYRVASDPAGAAGASYTELRDRVQTAPVMPATREHALALLALLANAEAKVHGTTVEKVHFHEIADWYSLMDIVAAGCIAANLAGARWTATPPPLGGGRVNTAHGVLPVPAPATCALLEGYPWRDDGIAGERVTPTGAAILRHLVSAGDCTGRSATGRMIGIGSGAGTRTLPGTPNIVRALLFERERHAIASGIDGDIVSVLEFDVDDMTGEEIALAAERLRELAGVIDASLGMRVGKKGRPLTEFRVLANPAAASNIAHACFTETSTLGLRVREERRHVLRRAEVVAKIDETTVNVKVAQRPGGVRTGKAAHDDVVAGSGLDDRRKSSASAVQRALEDDAS